MNKERGDQLPRAAQGKSAARTEYSRQIRHGKRAGQILEKADGKPAEKSYSADKKPCRNTEKKTESSGRTAASESSCKYASTCGACQLIDVSYDRQLEQKQKKISGLLKPFCPVRPITGASQIFHYRNKTHAVLGKNRKGEIISGTYQEGTHRLVPVDHCLIENEKADAIIRDIRTLARSFKYKIYDEDSGYGLLRHVLVRTAHATGEILVVLVLRSPILPSRNHFVKALLQLHPQITSIVLNVNDRKTSMVLGEKETVIFGKGYIEDILGGCRFRISSRSFYQINSEQTEKLYAKAIELAALTGKERVLDAYCGIGTIGILASSFSREVIGIELNMDAVRDARKNAFLNDIHNIRFCQKDAGEFLTQLAAEGEHADVVFMDPPRTGSSREFLTSLIRLSPSRIVYISCGPESLARDLEFLTSNGYKAQEAWPFDLFCHTVHVETVCLLTHS